MTVNSSAPKRQDFTGTGLSGPFPILIPIGDKTQVKAVKTEIATGESETLVLDSDYTVSSDLADLTLTDPLPVTHKLTLLLQTVVEQVRDFLPGNPFPPDIFERMADDLTRHVLCITEQQDRAVRLSDGDPREGGVTIDPLVANKYVAVSSDASKLVMADVAPDVDAYLAGLLAGVPSVQIVQDNIASVNTVAGISSSVVTVAGMSAILPTVAGMAADISTVIGLTATMNAAIAASIPESLNYIWNGGMLLWRGYTGAVTGSVSARIRVVEGWSCAQTGLGTGIEASQNATGSSIMSQFALQLRRATGSTNVNEMNAVFNLSPEESYPLRGQNVVAGLRALRGADLPLGSLVNVDVMYTTNPGVNVITNGDGSYSAGHNVAGTFSFAPGTSYTSFASGATAITVPSTAVQVALRVRWTPPVSAAGANEFVRMTDVYLCRGVGSVRPRPIRQSMAMLHALKQWRRTCLATDAFATPSNPGAIVAAGGAALNSKAFSTDPTQLVWNMMYGDIPLHYTPNVTWFSPQGTVGGYGASSTTTTGVANLIGASDSLVSFQGSSGTPTVGTLYCIGFEAEARL